MPSIRRKGSEEARTELPALIKAAERGQPTLIMRHGRPVAALMPLAALGKGAPAKTSAKTSGKSGKKAKRRRRS